MNIIQKKLHSGKGASITFALLLFLVCAVVSSVVLVAGTTAAGRLSGMAESEQKYYSVTSTAKVIQELMEGEQITIIEYDDERYFVGTGSQLTEISSKTPKSLPEYIAAQICDSNVGNESFSISSENSKLNSALSEVSISGSLDGYDDVLFTVRDKGYSFKMRFTTNKESAPIDIDSETAAGNRTVYSWILADMGSY